MIKKLLKLFCVFLLLPSLAFGGWYYGSTTSLTCQLLYEYAPASLLTAFQSFGRFTTTAYIGAIFTPGTTVTTCKISVKIYDRIIATSLPNYYFKIYTLDGSNNFDTLVATSSDYQDGDNMADGTWLDASPGWITIAGNFTAGTPHVIVMYPDTNGDGTPDVSSTNYIRLAFDDEDSGETQQTGLGLWGTDGVLNTLDAQDALGIKIWALQP